MSQTGSGTLNEQLLNWMLSALPSDRASVLSAAGTLFAGEVTNAVLTAGPASPAIGGNAAAQLAGIAQALNGLQAGADNTLFNAAWSAADSLPQALLLHETPTNLSFLSNRTAILVPDAAAQASHSPTIAQLFGAANAAYTLDPASPLGLTPFLVDGKQLAAVDQVSGLSARTWINADHQVIIAYSGTGGGDTVVADPSQVIGQYAADVPSLAGINSQAQKDALSFARLVTQEAAKQGIGTNNIFVSGHSLGGGIAEYVAQQSGLGGTAFDGTGIPASSGAVGDGSNFISFDTYGDVWGGYSSDIEGDQPAAPAFVAGGGELAHRGTVIMLGDVADQVSMQNDLRALGGGALAVVGDFAVKAPTFHYPGNQAADLGITPYPYSVSQDTGGAARGVVFNVGGDTIAQTIAANAARTDYHSTALPHG